MGTDIHGNVEINGMVFSDEDVWSKQLEICILAEREYLLFGALFGVRNEG
ncbi:hypothetical protein [Marinicella meishanensis]|nr:hypothetical protein [Marinicella sp. NBU2979]